MPAPPLPSPPFLHPDARPLRGVLLLAVLLLLAAWVVVVAVFRPLCVPSRHEGTIARGKEGVLFNRREGFGP